VTHRRLFLAAIALVTTLPVACGADSNDVVRTIRVPADRPTIQAAVDAARPGDMVLVDAGTYREAVKIDTKQITLRGMDRNTVVLDGGDKLANGVTVTANGVAVENMTIHSYTQNAVLFNGATSGDGTVDPNVVYGSAEYALDGYRAAYLTTYNNGLYGVYAFASRNGTIEHSYASGHPDSGIYVGQCSPCNAVVDEVTAERNAIGYYGTNASGAVYIVRSTFRHNRLGMTPNSQKMELLAPQVESFVVGNLVTDNDDPQTPEIPRGFFAGGIAIGGGTKDVIARNRVTGHDGFGIGLVELNQYEPQNNEITGNVLADNNVDLLYRPSTRVKTTLGNCFGANTYATSAPDAIETSMPCPTAGDKPVELGTVQQPAAPPGVDYRTMPPPGKQPSMPGDLTIRPAAPAGAPTIPDLDTIKVPGGH
jgi:hypothetical protein